MARILAVSDEVDEHLIAGDLKALEVELVVACGDLPCDYLEALVTLTNVPLLYVPGNHDPEGGRPAPDPVAEDDVLRPFSFRREEDATRPEGCINLDGRVIEIKGLRVAGLGGSMRYSGGPNQYTQAEMKRRALVLEARARLGSLLHRRPSDELDVLLTHAPPLGVGDDDDPAHEGFAAFHRLVERLSPRILLHGHIHPYGRRVVEHRLNGTRVVNAVGHKVIEV
jgi:predicted phosphodiesterase